ncbi:hypothetical protein Tco_0232111 [Tanacetum coccineum]
MSCSLPQTVEEIKEFVQKQCDIDDAARQEAIIASVRLLEVKTKNTSWRLETSRSSSREEKLLKCGDPNHLIEEYSKPPKDKNQRTFVGGSWSDSGKKDDEKTKDETCLIAQASNEECSDSSYFSDENSSIDDLTLDNEYDKLFKMSLKIITKNKRLKAIRNSLENELSELKSKLSTLEKNKRVDLECTNCQSFKTENGKLKEKALKLTKFEKSTHCLNEMLSNQKSFGDKLGLWFNSCEASAGKSKEIKFVKSQKETYSGGGPPNIMGGPHKVQTTPKEIKGPPVCSLESEKSVSFQKSILGPRPKHIMVNNVKIPVASDNEVKQFYKPTLKPGVGFYKSNFRRSRLGNPDDKDSDVPKHIWVTESSSQHKGLQQREVYFWTQNVIISGRVTFSEHDSEITKDGKVIGRDIRKKDVYVMKLRNKPEDKICLGTIDENSTLWHNKD